MSVGFYPVRGYQPLVEFVAIRRAGLKSFILADEQVDTAGCLPAIRDSMCVGGDRVFIKCERGNFRLHTPRRHGSARIYVGTEYISLSQPDVDYLVRVFHVAQQLRDYIIALPDVLSCHIVLKFRVIYRPIPIASKSTDNPHLYEELVSFV